MRDPMTREDREVKLPRWAQETLSGLRTLVSVYIGEAEELRARLEEMAGVAAAGGTDTILDPDADAPQPLRWGTTVRFLPHPGGQEVDTAAGIEVHVDENGRVVAETYGSDLAIVPTDAPWMVELRPLKRGGPN